MSNDLISRQDLLEELFDLFQDDDELYIAGRVIYLVQNLPTAYDVEGVVKRLEEKKKIYNRIAIEAMKMKELQLQVASRNQAFVFEEAIEIVKKGGAV